MEGLKGIHQSYYCLPPSPAVADINAATTAYSYLQSCQTYPDVNRMFSVFHLQSLSFDPIGRVMPMMILQVSILKK